MSDIDTLTSTIRTILDRLITQDIRQAQTTAEAQSQLAQIEKLAARIILLEKNWE